jgi:hypothetical protein
MGLGFKSETRIRTLADSQYDIQAIIGLQVISLIVFTSLYRSSNIAVHKTFDIQP